MTSLPPFPPLTPNLVWCRHVCHSSGQPSNTDLGNVRGASSATMALPSLFVLLTSSYSSCSSRPYARSCFSHPTPALFLCLTYLLLATVLRARMGVQQATPTVTVDLLRTLLSNWTNQTETRFTQHKHHSYGPPYGRYLSSLALAQGVCRVEICPTFFVCFVAFPFY